MVAGRLLLYFSFARKTIFQIFTSEFMGNSFLDDPDGFDNLWHVEEFQAIECELSKNALLRAYS